MKMIDFRRGFLKVEGKLVDCLAYGYLLTVRYIEDGQVFARWTFQIFSDSPVSDEYLFFLKEGDRDEGIAK